MHKKGQAAMEFLMTYGWAILIVLIAIGALAYFGVLSPDRFLPEKCAISTGSGIFCDDFSVDSDSQVRLSLHNILTDSMTNVVVDMTNGGGGTGSCTSPAINISADGTATATLTCGTVLSEKIKADLEIDYTIRGFTKKTTGTLTGRTP
jgi:hypothetical protein